MLKTTKLFVELHEKVLDTLLGLDLAEQLCQAINWTLTYTSSRTPDELVYLAEVRARWIKRLIDTDVAFSMDKNGDYYV